jgi:hypothetical protein
MNSKHKGETMKTKQSRIFDVTMQVSADNATVTFPIMATSKKDASMLAMNAYQRHGMVTAVNERGTFRGFDRNGKDCTMTVPE